MTYSKTNLARHFALAGFLGFVAGAGVACGGSSENNNNGDQCATPAEGRSVAADGQCCWFSINCQAGSICNNPDDDLYKATEAQGVCVKVICSTNADCKDSGETCSP
jgi:hypothetical protein